MPPPGESGLSKSKEEEKQTFGTGGVAQFSPLQYSCVKRDSKAVKALLTAGVDVDHKNAYGDSALHYAAGNGDDEIVLSLLKHKASVNLANSYGQTPLHHAAQMGQASVCIHLIHFGADTEALSQKGKRAIDVTKDSKTRRALSETKPWDSETIRKEIEGDLHPPTSTERGSERRKYSGDMLRNGVDEAAGVSEFTDLMYACTRKDLVAVRQIIRTDPAQVRVRNVYGDTALHYACKGQDIEMVETLLQHDADVHAQNQFGQFPIDHAAKGSPEIFATLKDYGALWDKKQKRGMLPEGPKPCLWFVHSVKHQLSGCTSGVVWMRFSRNKDIDINLKNAYGDTALHYGVQGGLKKVVEELIAHSAEVDIQNDFGQTALHHAAQVRSKTLPSPGVLCSIARTHRHNKGKAPYALAKDAEIRRMLRETKKAAKFSVVSITEHNPEDDAAGDGVIKTVTRKAPEAEEQGMMSISPLMYACVRSEDEKVREILRKAGEENWPELVKQINAYGDTALHYAAQQGNRDIVSLLLDAKADPDVQNRYGLTALHQAASVSGSATSAAGQKKLAAAVEVVQELLERGADKYLKDEKGNAPLDLARYDDIKFLLML
ncbi:hypothetical protein FOL47_008968 [Perkinsus chesapeaki]|uniref:Ankyrin Repeat Protein n=1 Tax=Perkinsus chesapeaki TaxID=330153 RepID=A0A7J6N1Y8_PERCH|nr:hypothetical protein FOL47_008968 [Perkinsus chesapeaki]